MHNRINKNIWLFNAPLQIFMTHFDVEEPGFEGVHLTGAFAEVVYDQVEGSGGQEVRVRVAELLSTCGVKNQVNRTPTDAPLSNVRYTCGIL